MKKMSRSHEKRLNRESLENKKNLKKSRKRTKSLKAMQMNTDWESNENEQAQV